MLLSSLKMYADSKCSCFFAELVNALVMVHPLYFVIVPGFSDNVIVSYSESTVCCVSIMYRPYKVRNSTCPLARDKWIFRRTTKIANIVVRRTTWIAAGSVTRQRSSYFGDRFERYSVNPISSGMKFFIMKSTKTTT